MPTEVTPMVSVADNPDGQVVLFAGSSGAVLLSPEDTDLLITTLGQHRDAARRTTVAKAAGLSDLHKS